jgi:KipI family sensor histidine kinase inhibitor
MQTVMHCANAKYQKTEANSMDVTAIRSLADSAITFDLDDKPGARAAARVRGAVTAINAWIVDNALGQTVEVVGAFASITVHYDPLRSAQADLVEAVIMLLANTAPTENVTTRLWRLPCCYDGAHGADLVDLAVRLNLPQEQIIARHKACIFDVFAMGFLPGLPFMGELPGALSLPRRSSPRQLVPKGSVAIANGLCIIYPGASPGGWHIIGHCPVALFDVHRDTPALLTPGDQVQFEYVTLEQHHQIEADLAHGTIAPHDYLKSRSVA